MSERIQMRRDTAARWAQYNPILLEGEIGYVTDSMQFKIGDGMHAWNELPYINFGSGGGNVKSVTLDGGCNTAMTDALKKVAVDGLDILTTSMRLLIRMTNANTADNVTLNINSLGEKPLYYNNVRASGGNSWKPGEVLDVYYDGTNFYGSNVLGSSASGGNLIIDWKTDVSATRLSVQVSDRKAGMHVSYNNPDSGWVNEQYIGTAVTDSEWVKDGNWKSVDSMELVDSYESDSKNKAPTADALHRLYMKHGEDIGNLSDAMVDLENKVNAVLDMVSSSSEIGISPASIEVSSAAQDVVVQIICNGDWTVSEVPEYIEVTPLSGTGNGHVTVKFPVNESEEDEVTGSFKISNGFGKEKTVSFTQGAAEKTYVYELSVLPESLDLNASSGSGSLVVTSTKTPYVNGIPAGEAETVPYTLSSDADWLHVQNTGEYTYDENQSERSRNAQITVVAQDGGKKVTVNVLQEEAQVDWVYEFSVSPQTVSLVNAGTAQTVEVISRKQKRINGVNEGDAVSVDYSSSITAGFEIDGNSISAAPNNTEDAKSGTATFTQNESGRNATVAVTQAAGTVTWEYTFTVSPTSLAFSEKGETKSVAVTSTKQKRINGMNSGNPVTVGYTRANSGTGVSGNSTDITMSENTGSSSRTGSVKFTQSESSKTATVSLSQSAAKITYTYSLSVSSTSVTLKADGTEQELTVTSKRQKYVNGKASGGLENYDWNFDLQSGFTYTKVSQTQLRIKGNNNTTTSQKTGQCIIRQKTDGGKSATINVTQSPGSRSYRHVWEYSPPSITLSSGNSSGTVNFQRIYQTLWNGIVTAEQNVSGNLSNVSVTKNGSGTTHISASVSGKTVNVRRTGSPDGIEMYSCQVSVPAGDTVPGSFQVVLQN